MQELKPNQLLGIVVRDSNSNLDIDNNSHNAIEEYRMAASLFDSDGDGMSDEYETKNELNLLVVNGHLNFDDDWISNYAEFRANTDLNIPLSVPLLTISLLHVLLLISLLFSLLLILITYLIYTGSIR